MVSRCSVLAVLQYPSFCGSYCESESSRLLFWLIFWVFRILLNLWHHACLGALTSNCSYHRTKIKDKVWDGESSVCGRASRRSLTLSPLCCVGIGGWATSALSRSPWLDYFTLAEDSVTHLSLCKFIIREWYIYIYITGVLGAVLYGLQDEEGFFEMGEWAS